MGWRARAELQQGLPPGLWPSRDRVQVRRTFFGATARSVVLQERLRTVADLLCVLPDVADVKDAARQALVGPLLDCFQEMPADLGAFTDEFETHAAADAVDFRIRMADRRAIMPRSHLCCGQKNLPKKTSIPSVGRVCCQIIMKSLRNTSRPLQWTPIGEPILIRNDYSNGRFA